MSTIDTTDPRFAKALAIAENSGQWLRIRRDGKCIAVGIPSSKGDRHYIVTTERCDCEDTKRHSELVCKHRQALLIEVARRGQKPRPTSDVLDGLAEMVANAGRHAAIFDGNYADNVGDVPLHARSDDHYGTVCILPLEGRAWTANADDATCRQCRQILETRAQTAREIADGSLWSRFS